MDPSSSWRSPASSSKWHNPRFSPHQEKLRSSYSPNFRSPRYQGMRFNRFNSSYPSTSTMLQEQPIHFRPHQQHFRPRGPTYQGTRPGRNSCSIDNWILPEMWENPWTQILISKSSNSALYNFSSDKNLGNSNPGMKLSTKTEVEDRAAVKIVNSNINLLQSHTDSVLNL